MSKAFFPLSLASAIVFTLPNLAHATIINFDDIPVSEGSKIPIVNPYAGFIWSGVDVENHFGGGAGYNNGIVSNSNAAVATVRDSSFTTTSGTFTFVSGDFTMATGIHHVLLDLPITITNENSCRKRQPWGFEKLRDSYGSADI